MNNSENEGFRVNTNIEETRTTVKAYTKLSVREEIFEWFDIISIALIAVLIIFGLLFRIATISGDSMLNTLHDGERIILRDVGYKPQNGDIVVISRNIENKASTEYEDKGPIIKRIIATENQTVEIDFDLGIVYVDGKALEEDYTSTPTIDRNDFEGPMTVPEGHIFVLGDNRTISLDSRSKDIGTNGMIDERYILGQAIFRVFPFDKIGRLDNK
jgi:signal peptidase I